MDSAIKRAEAKLEYLSSDKEAIELYNAREDALHEKANLITTGKMQKAIEVTKKLLSKGIDISVISEVTELTLEKIGKCFKR